MSPRTLVLLALVAVGLLGLAVWEILGAGADPPIIRTAADEPDEPTGEDAAVRRIDREDDLRVVREALRRAAEIEVEGADSATEEDAEDKRREPARKLL